MFMSKSWSAMNADYIPAFAGVCFPLLHHVLPCLASWGRRIEEK